MQNGRESSIISWAEGRWEKKGQAGYPPHPWKVRVAAA